ncbi:MAG: EAL domain-containing protein [Rhodoferax sp.]|uniref:bifunctional diguanylate cyclase/phosphodiesterase n=1 Tax=Rhodoferax sp. TaxID=50421 RepID=UPI00261AC565|nr:EAL domain-containing protein [Rhodoferax sp.]MDD2882706.1 EAL domain-containing protein [Rhodoferax sp.]
MRLSLRFTPALVAVLSVLLMVAYSANLVLGARAVTIERANVQTENFSRVLEEHARQTLRRVGGRLTQADIALQRLLDTGKLDVPLARQQLTRLLPDDQLIQNFLVLDHTGTVVLSTMAEPDAGNGPDTTLDYFAPHIRGADRELVFGRPIKTANGQWLLPVSCRLGGTGGAFSGIVVAMVRATYFQTFYDSIERGADGFVTLFLSSGWAVVTSPMADSVIGKNWSDTAMFRQHMPSWPTGTVRQVVDRDGIERIYSYRALNDFPVVVSYGLSLASVLSPWQYGAWRHGLLLAAAALLLAGAAVKMKQQEAARLRTVRELQASEDKYRTLIEWTPEAVLVHRRGKILYGNPAAIKLFGASNAQALLRKTTQQLIHPDEQAYQAARMKNIVDGAPQAPSTESRFLKLDGTSIDVIVQGTSVVYEGEPAIHVSIHDITERKQAQQAQALAASEIDNLAFYDPLTHLPNRRLLMDRLAQALTASIHHTRKSALLFVDLDNFKTLNDTLGHHQGDALLVQVAQRLKSCVREGDSVARLGSDEFVVMLEDLSENALDAATQVEAVGEKILATLGQSYPLDNGAHHSTASIGVTLFGDTLPESSEEPLKRAELAMFQAKAVGRNTLRFFDAQMQAEVSAHAALEADLREAVAKQQFLLHYQAQVVGSGRVTGVEALVRWQHPQRGMVSPAAFIPLAEASGLILPIGQWVLETACAQLAAWASQPALAHLTIAVNVSARQFRQADFVDTVLATLARTRARPKLLKLELTESMLVDDVEGIIAKMGTLKGTGVGFSLDDFGTGYSSLTYLKRLPLDQLKIDQGFVRNIVTDTNDAAIARMVIALAESTGLSVIAEGVELQAQADFLAHLGCHAYQGYLFSKPLPLAAFEAFAKRV